MSLTVIDGPSAEPLDVEAMRDFLRLGSDEQDQDSVIRALIKSARARAETYTRRAFVSRTVRLTLDGFGGYDHWIRIPMAPVQSIEKVEYLDTAGSLVEMDANAYTLSVSQQPARLLPAYGQHWPTPRQTADSVRIEFTAGYGNSTTVPDDILQAMRLDIAHLFEFRGDDAAGVSPSEPCMLARAYLDPHRLWL